MANIYVFRILIHQLMPLFGTCMYCLHSLLVHGSFLSCPYVFQHSLFFLELFLADNAHWYYHMQVSLVQISTITIRQYRRRLCRPNKKYLAIGSYTTQGARSKFILFYLSMLFPIERVPRVKLSYISLQLGLKLI